MLFSPIGRNSTSVDTAVVDAAVASLRGARGAGGRFRAWAMDTVTESGGAPVLVEPCSVTARDDDECSCLGWDAAIDARVGSVVSLMSWSRASTSLKGGRIAGSCAQQSVISARRAGGAALLRSSDTSGRSPASTASHTAFD